MIRSLAAVFGLLRWYYIVNRLWCNRASLHAIMLLKNNNRPFYCRFFAIFSVDVHSYAEYLINLPSPLHCLNSDVTLAISIFFHWLGVLCIWRWFGQDVCWSFGNFLLSSHMIYPMFLTWRTLNEIFSAAYNSSILLLKRNFRLAMLWYSYITISSLTLRLKSIFSSLRILLW